MNSGLYKAKTNLKVFSEERLLSDRQICGKYFQGGILKRNMAKLTASEIQKLAELSRLKLSNDALKRFQNQFNDILSYVEQLKKIDTTGFEPTSQVTGLENVYRQDATIDYKTTPDDLLEGVPATIKRYIKTKRVL